MKKAVYALDKELAESLDLYDHERAYRVEVDGHVVGSVSCWEDGTMTFFDNQSQTDTDIEALEEVETLI